MKTPPSNTLGFLKTTAIGGVLFLLPIVVVIVLLGYVFKAVVSVHGVLKEWIPFDSATGIALLFVLAVILIFAACFVAGLIAHRAIGVHFSRTMESHLMKVYPKYGIYKDLLAGKFGGAENAPSLSPVLVRKGEFLYPAFQADRLASGLIVVYFPGSPDTWNGSLALVGPDRVHPMDVPFAALIDIYERLGRDSSSQLNTAVGRIETRNIQPGTA